MDGYGWMDVYMCAYCGGLLCAPATSLASRLVFLFNPCATSSAGAAGFEIQVAHLSAVAAIAGGLLLGALNVV